MLGGVGIGGNHYANKCSARFERFLIPSIALKVLRNMYEYISLVGFDLLAKVFKLLIKFPQMSQVKKSKVVVAKRLFTRVQNSLWEFCI